MLSWVGTAGKKNRSHLLAEGMARAGGIRAGFISRAPPSAGPRGHGQGLASASRAPMTALRGRAPVGGDTRDRASPALALGPQQLHQCICQRAGGWHGLGWASPQPGEPRTTANLSRFPAPNWMWDTL